MGGTGTPIVDYLNTFNVDYNTQNTQDILEQLQKRNINININDNTNVNNTDINASTNNPTKCKFCQIFIAISLSQSSFKS